MGTLIGSAQAAPTSSFFNDLAKVMAKNDKDSCVSLLSLKMVKAADADVGMVFAITAKGRKELAREEENWERLTEGVRRVLRYA